MDDILEEVQTRSSHYDQIENSYESLVREANELSVQLESTLQEKESSLQQVQEVRMEMSQAKSDLQWLRQTNKDLSRQLQVLLLEIEELQGRVPSGSLAELEKAAAGGVPVDGVQGIISERLVAFSNIQSLQAKNMELLEIVRKLSDRTEADELEQRQIQLDEMKRKYGDAMTQLQSLVEERKKNEVIMQSVINERDMYKRISQDQPENPFITEAPRVSSPSRLVAEQVQQQTEMYRKQLVDLQTDFDAYRKETSLDNRSLQEQLHTSQKEVSDFRVQNAQSKTQNAFLQGLCMSASIVFANFVERSQVLNGTIDQQTKELTELRHRHSTLMANIAQFEHRLRDASDAKSQLESEVERLKYENSHLNAMKDLLGVGEVRAAEERALLIKERDRLNDLIRSLQTMHSELERTEGESKRQLRAEKETLEKELGTARNRLVEDASEIKSLTIRKDAEIKDWQLKYERAVEDHQRAREAQVVNETKMQALNDRIQLLTEELTKKEGEIRQLRMRGSTIAAATLRRLQQVQAGGALPAAAILTETSSDEINIVVEAEQAEQEIRSRERQLEGELQKLRYDICFGGMFIVSWSRHELEEAKHDGNRQRKHTETYQELSKTAEEKLASMNEAFETYRTTTDTKISSLEVCQFQY